MTEYDSIEGRAWVFGDNVDTDQIIQGRYLTCLDYSKMAKHTLEIPRPEFADEVNKGDVIVAGKNFGGGSSREEAPQVLKEVGVGCVVAESFARIFYRNAINIGLPIMQLDEASSIPDGSVVEISLESAQLTIKDSGTTLSGNPLPALMKEILYAGGAIPWFRSSREKEGLS
ncbi:MAG: 3-isopropylmalate dehydratase small subunit [Promethearchaeia archaeon]